MAKLRIDDVARAMGWRVQYTRLAAQDGELPFVHAKKVGSRGQYSVY